MGTFIIRPSSVASGGSPYFSSVDQPGDYTGWIDFTNDPKKPMIEFLQGTAPPLVSALSAEISRSGIGSGTFNDTIRCAFSGACIYLDGSLVPIAFASLPAGFTPTSAGLNVYPFLSISGPADNQWNLQHGVGVNDSVNTILFPYDFSLTPVSMINLMGNGCGLKLFLRVSQAEGNFTELINLIDLRIEGTYDIVSYSWTITTPSPVSAGASVTVTSTNGGLDGVDSVVIQYTDAGGVFRSLTATITNQPADGNSITFTLPSGSNPGVDGFGSFAGTIYINFVGNGVQFSGSVPAGTMTIAYADASGIYQIVPNKTSDTVYDRTGTTLEVKIPDPIWKTGFIDG